jgi:hypothetical protein
VSDIRSGLPPMNAPEHAYHVLEVLLKTREAGRTGQMQPIERMVARLAFE